MAAKSFPAGAVLLYQRVYEAISELLPDELMKAYVAGEEIQIRVRAAVAPDGGQAGVLVSAGAPPDTEPSRLLVGGLAGAIGLVAGGIVATLVAEK
jgi:hypothetical protein